MGSWRRSQSWVTTRKKNWRENNDNEVKSSVFTSIDLRVVFSHRVSSKTIIYLNTEWVICLSIANKENKRSGPSEYTSLTFKQIFENLVDNSKLNFPFLVPFSYADLYPRDV